MLRKHQFGDDQRKQLGQFSWFLPQRRLTGSLTGSLTGKRLRTLRSAKPFTLITSTVITSVVMTSDSMLTTCKFDSKLQSRYLTRSLHDKSAMIILGGVLIKKFLHLLVWIRFLKQESLYAIWTRESKSKMSNRSRTSRSFAGWFSLNVSAWKTDPRAVGTPVSN